MRAEKWYRMRYHFVNRSLTVNAGVIQQAPSEASLGPPRWVAGLGGIVAVGCWVRSGPSLPSDDSRRRREAGRLVRTGLAEQAGGHGCGGDGKRCA